MNIVAITRSFQPREGGAERQLRHILSRLASAGHRVTVITERVSGSPSREQLPSGVRIKRVGTASARGPIAQLLFVVGAMSNALGLRPSVLLSLQLGAASACAALVARILRRPHILRLTGGGNAVHRSEPLSKASSRAGRAISTLYDRRGTTVVAPAQHLLADFAEAFPRSRASLRHIPNGVQMLEGPRTKDRDVIWYSRAVSEGSAEIFLDVARQLVGTTITVIGNWVDVEGVPNITQLGWLTAPEEEISRHRVLINTSVREGMPNTVLQALSLGCRVVAFDNAGTREVRERFGDAVTLVPYSDARAFSAAVRECLRRDRPAKVQVESYEEVVLLWSELVARAPGLVA